MATDGLEIIDRKARENIPSELIPQQEEILAFSQILCQRSIPEILRRYDATRPRNTALEIPTGSELAKSSNNSSDPGYGTMSETGTYDNAGQEERGTCEKPSSATVEDSATHQEATEDKQVQGPQSQTLNLNDPQSQFSGFLNFEDQMHMPKFDFEEFLNNVSADDDMNWNTIVVPEISSPKYDNIKVRSYTSGPWNFASP
ncbi:hypothetical protein GGR53DRAFT_45288 [Hypoxylon sp. FL1150]|nr:hypothetical protein GGR53DRAFT_45288 [Hypoxylon sp. FL1150]